MNIKVFSTVKYRLLLNVNSQLQYFVENLNRFYCLLASSISLKKDRGKELNTAAFLIAATFVCTLSKQINPYQEINPKINSLTYA
jgi:hypothetical protein